MFLPAVTALFCCCFSSYLIDVGDMSELSDRWKWGNFTLTEAKRKSEALSLNFSKRKHEDNCILANIDSPIWTKKNRY